jgi:formyltetrahydrofolate-dependent phosphoribosylglycinamide formyltransferase
MADDRAAQHRARIAVLASGGGSNLGALLDHYAALAERRRGDVVLVASDRASAGALERARAAGIAAHHVAAHADGDAIVALLRSHRVDLVVLAGYLRLVPRAVVVAFRGRILNVHPALLPAFGGAGMYGARVHQAVIDGGARITGATVHFVDDQYDRGAIVAQWPVPVFEEDDATTLAARVLAVEHALYPRIVDAVAGDAIALDDDGRVRGAFLVGAQGRAFVLPRAELDAATLAAEIDAAIAR